MGQRDTTRKTDAQRGFEALEIGINEFQDEFIKLMAKRGNGLFTLTVKVVRGRVCGNVKTQVAKEFPVDTGSTK